MVGTHGDEPLDNKADAAPEKADAAAPAKEEADPKSPEAVEKRQAEAKDKEGRAEIIDNDAEAAKKLTKDSSTPQGDSLPKGLEA